jgi:hypothetical protein
LLVYVVVTDASGNESEAGEPLAAGFESWRTQVWEIRMSVRLAPRSSPGSLRATR